MVIYSAQEEEEEEELTFQFSDPHGSIMENVRSIKSAVAGFGSSILIPEVHPEGLMAAGTINNSDR